MENLSFPKKLIKTWIMPSLLAVSALSLTACPAKNSGGGDPGPVVISTCTTACASILTPAVLLQTNSNSGYDIKMSWQLLGDATTLASTSPASTVYGNYVGPVIARGGMTVITQLSSNTNGACVIPVGTYTYDTVGAPGAIRQGSFVISVLQANGPVSFQFSANGVIGGFGQSIYAGITILSINGVSCGSTGTTVN